jgi:hypothetical protein
VARALGHHRLDVDIGHPPAAQLHERLSLLFAVAAQQHPLELDRRFDLVGVDAAAVA